MSDQRQTGPEDGLMAAARRLPREIPPERDLWPGIRDRIESLPGPATAVFMRPRNATAVRPATPARTGN